MIDARPLAYWRLEEWGGATASDATAAKRDATYGVGIARWLDGPASPAFSGPGAVNRCVHLAGGRLSAEVAELKDAYSVELRFWNGLSAACVRSRGVLVKRAATCRVVGGTSGAPGCLTFGALSGRTVIRLKT